MKKKENTLLLYFVKRIHIVFCIVCVVSSIFCIIFFVLQDAIECDTPLLQGRVYNICNTTLDNTTLDNTTLDNTTLDNTTLDNTTLDNTTLDNTTLDNTTLDNTTLDNTTLDNTKIQVYYNISLHNIIYTIPCSLHNYTKKVYCNSTIDIYITDNLYICYEFYETCTTFTIVPIFIIIISCIISCFTGLCFLLCTTVCIYKCIGS